MGGFFESIFDGLFDGNYLGQLNRCEIRLSDLVALGFSICTPSG